MINPEKILVTCLSTGEIRYIDETMLLFKTLNVFQLNNQDELKHFLTVERC